MPRPRSEEPRTEGVFIRITSSQGDILDAAASIRSVSPTTLAYRVIAGMLESFREDNPEIDTLVQIREDWQTTHPDTTHST